MENISKVLEKYPGHKMTFLDDLSGKTTDFVIVLRSNDADEIRYIRADKNGRILFDVVMDGNPSGVKIFTVK